MPRFYARTSVSIDEAIAILLGLSDGPIEFQAHDDDCNAEDQTILADLRYDLREELEEAYDECQSRLVEARLDGISPEQITDLEAQLAAARRNIDWAYRCRCALEHELLKTPPALLVDPRLSEKHLPFVTLESLRIWAATNKTIRAVRCELATGRSDLSTQQKGDDRSAPCWQIVPDDPKEAQEWYRPARYFARQLIDEDPSLATKRSNLAAKVAGKLEEAKIFKRGGKKPLDSSTILKAFVNVKF